MRVMTQADVCAEARISAATLARRYRAGNGPKAHRSGRCRFVLREDFDAWLESQAAA